MLYVRFLLLLWLHDISRRPTTSLGLTRLQSKAAVIMLAKSLATEYVLLIVCYDCFSLKPKTRWAPHSICVNTLSPGYMHTDLITDLLDKEGNELVNSWMANTPLRRMGNPAELQGTVVWMASEASSFMTGANIVRFLLFCPSISSRS